MSEVITDLDFTDLSPPERTRIYDFGNRGTLTFVNVVRLCVRPSGSHRLETADGKKHIVAAGWLGVTLDVDGWTR